jgi:molybdopterin molybdotransferase
MNTPLLDPDKALAIIHDAAAPLPLQTCALNDARGRILRQPIASPSSLPPFDNSAMDGYALAGTSEPVAAGTTLPVEGEQAAGDRASQAKHGAWEIMT